MDWIEAALAFAVVMMLLSTAVTIIIDTSYNILRIREKGLRRLIESLYQDILLPRLPQAATDGPVDKFVELITRSRYSPVGDDVNEGRQSWVKRLVNARELKNLTTFEFVERLAETPAGRHLYDEAQRRGGEYLDVFLGDLASKYEDFSQGSIEYFARRAKLTSAAVAVVLAFALNINAVHLYQTLLFDKEVRQVWLDQGEDIARRAQDAETQLQRLAAGETGAEVTKEDIDEDIEELKGIANSLETAGIPIGWGSAPWNEARWTDKNFLQAGVIIAGWLLSVLLAGMLIGLGGPFWFNVFRKLGALAGMVRGMQTTVQKAKEQALTAIETDSKEFTKVFENASKANALADVGGRAQLTPEGPVDRGNTQ